MSGPQFDSRATISHAESGVVAWIKLPKTFDVEPLLDDVRGVPDEWWISHFNERDYTGQWTIAPLRGPAGETHPIRMAYSDPTATEWADTSLLESCPALRHVLAWFECPIKSARLMRLAAGAEILEHTDHELGLEDGEVRLHVPIETSPDVEFWLNGRRVEMRCGEVWYLNVNLPHRVANRSSSGRTHFVIDCEVNDWIRAVFNDAVNGKLP
jgi:quercetin dioxygenase-like cupin family protein